MKRDEIEAEVSLLLSEMEGDYGDSHEVYQRLRQLLDNMRAFGLALPEDLVILERELGAAFDAPAPAEPESAPDS